MDRYEVNITIGGELSAQAVDAIVEWAGRVLDQARAEAIRDDINSALADEEPLHGWINEAGGIEISDPETTLTNMQAESLLNLAIMLKFEAVISTGATRDFNGQIAWCVDGFATPWLAYDAAVGVTADAFRQLLEQAHMRRFGFHRSPSFLDRPIGRVINDLPGEPTCQQIIEWFESLCQVPEVIPISQPEPMRCRSCGRSPCDAATCGAVECVGTA